MSPPTANAGRTGGDRQFLFVNGRPFEAKVSHYPLGRLSYQRMLTLLRQAITKAFNEVFKSYAPQHFPSIVADFELATGADHFISSSNHPFDKS